MNKIELRRIGSLRLHPDNVAIFGPPTEEPNYEEIREDIRRRGLQEPLIILEDGTILSGHIRYASVCWTLEQGGLSKAEILEQVIAVRVHEDFESKEEELDYLMAANEKRRQLDPRRIATSYEKLVQVIEASLGGKRGKKGEALQGLADRLGTSHKLAKSYFTIFSSKIVPDEVKDKVNSKGLSPSAVLEAIKFAEDSAKRETRAPSMADVDAYIKTPKAKTSLADTVRQAAKAATVVTSTGASTPAPKPSPKPATVEVVPEPPKVAAPEPVVTPDPVPEPKPVRVSTVHTSHCCLEHGCKYSDPNCPVAKGEQKQQGPCETCGLISEGYFDDGSEDGSIGCDDEFPDSDPVEQIATARRLLKGSLGVIILNEISTSELLGLHTELTSYLLAMGIIKPAVEFTIPTTTLAQLELCASLVQGIGDNIQDPQATRDALLDLVNFAKIPIERLGTTKRGFEANGLYCPECLTKQYNTPSGESCENGHGGLEGITDSQATAIRMSQVLTDSKYKCCQCGSRVETAKDATHASCPKCGLVDTSEIESVDEQPTPEPTPSQPPPKDDVLLSDADLADLLAPEPEPTPEPKKPEYPIGLHTEVPLSSLKIDPPSPETKEAYKKAFQATPGATPKKTAEPKKDPPPPVQTKEPSPPMNDEEADLVSSVIDEFMEEIQKAGLAANA